MANPTGSAYLTANTGYVWMDGDVYEIPQTDQVEGAATGASFSGLGVENQPHQVILNKVNYTHAKQLTDEANIAALQAFMNLFTSSVGPTGYRKMPTQDSVLGSIVLIEQWGVISLLGLGGVALRNGLFTFNFPIAFPNAIWMLEPYWMSNAVGNGPGGAELALLGGIPLILEAITPLQKQGNTIASDLTDAEGGGNTGTIYVANSANDGRGITGIGWRALGY
jgi:hypothetical protein